MGLIPAAQNPLKASEHRRASAEHRLAMCRLATAGLQDPRFDVLDIELIRQPPSYTIETVRQLLAGTAGTKINWLIGADQLPRLHLWRDFDTLMQLVTFWVVNRPGSSIDFAALPPEVQAHRASLAKYTIDTPLFDISSTEVRRRILAGEPISELVHPAVENYIRENQLYR